MLGRNKRKQKRRIVQKHGKDQSFWEKSRRLLKVTGATLDLPVRKALRL